MPSGLARTSQVDFSAGMFRGRRDLIPANGFWDSANGLIDQLGSVYKRGGASYLATAFGSAGLRFIWDGWLTAGQKTVVGTTTKWGTVAGGTVTDIAGTGLTVPGRAAVFKGKLFLPGGNTFDGTTLATAEKVSAYYAVTANRVFAAEKDKVLMSNIGEAKWEATEFHQLPGGVEIVGLEGMRDRVAVFTTRGIWLISGVSKKLTDAEGNVQQTLDLYNADFVLWGNAGIAGWEGGLVVPGTDAIYLMQLGVSSERPAFTRLSEPIADLYRSYVRSGYTPGQATVYKGHYLLPIIGGGTVIDLLVCRLDLPSKPWTRLEGEGARVAALTTKVVTGSSRTPELLGALYAASEPRPITCAYLEPSGNAEKDPTGNPVDFSLTTRAYTTGGLLRNLVAKMRLRYELAGPAPAIQASVLAESEEAPASGARWGAVKWGGFNWGTPAELNYETLDTLALNDPGGSKPHTWHPRRKRRFVTFRFIQNAATSKLIVRSIEISVRQTGAS